LPLLAIMKKSDDSLSVLSAWALLQIHGASAKTASIIMPELIVGLSLPLPLARQNAAESLGQLGPFAKGAVPQLERTSKDKDPGVRDAANKALAAIQGKSS
jgi:HEAT repeat protein